MSLIYGPTRLAQHISRDKGNSSLSKASVHRHITSHGPSKPRKAISAFCKERATSLIYSGQPAPFDKLSSENMDSLSKFAG